MEDIFVNINHVQGDFVHHLIQNGTLKFLQQIYKTGILWKPRDCRFLRTSPSEEAYKEFTKYLTLILTAAKLYPLKTLRRDLLTYVVKQLPFFLFPPNLCRHKKQNHLIKRAKKFQEGKWEDSWKQSISEFETEQSNIKPQKELSTVHKVRKSEHFHQHGEISRAAKVFTNNEKPTNDPGHAEHLRQLFPHPSADYDIDRVVKFHTISALTKYIRSCSFLCAPDIDGWRLKNLLQRIFLSSDPDNEDLKVLVYD
jgi:hypothetical protein